MQGRAITVMTIQVAPRVQKLFVGPTVSFDVPGFLNLSLLYMDEKNHNGEKGKNGFGADTKPETLIEAATPP